jgi:hypothetical protein
MDSGKLFVLIITAIAIGSLAYMEWKSRRLREKKD